MQSPGTTILEAEERQAPERRSGCMRLSIMQPYLFPYIGYFQLISASDTFVFYDDVQYSKNGWVNRNRILVNGEASWLTLPLCKAEHTLPINARSYQMDRKTTASLLGKIDAAYRKAPYFPTIFPLISEILAFEDSNVARFNENGVRRIADLLGLTTRMLSSRDLLLDQELKGEDRVLAICQLLGAAQYLNASGGTALYRAETFADRGIELQFLPPTHLSYPQFGASPVENLSIIDVMMFNSPERVREMLRHS